MTTLNLFKHLKALSVQPKWQWYGFLLGWLVISLLTLSPAEQLPEVPGSDKTHHLIGFGGWVLLCSLGALKRLLWMSLFILFWGGVIELIQPYVNRFGEWLDFGANSLGVVLALLGILLFRYGLSKISPTP